VRSDDGARRDDGPPRGDNRAMWTRAARPIDAPRAYDRVRLDRKRRDEKSACQRRIDHCLHEFCPLIFLIDAVAGRPAVFMNGAAARGGDTAPFAIFLVIVEWV
jgi:hypothetical protein